MAHEEPLSGALQGILVRPDGAEEPAVGVLVLHGSSGQAQIERARLLAGEGALALAMRWFGGPGQPPGICEIPLEGFVAALDRLQVEGARRIGVVGVSKGAEAALLLACRDPRVASVVAIAPTSVVWANVGPGRDGQTFPYRSSWNWRGKPLPFVPYDDAWAPASLEDGRIAYRTLYEQSLRTYPTEAAAAAIPIE
ncbi:MAG: acyl-CoA thioester hydrolase/BAAT C-terminal domain-containing protein [Ktedonobacterales bacterium]